MRCFLTVSINNYTKAILLYKGEQMSTAKFEKLINLIINEDQARAEQLFHEIIVEKSREIYESLMEDDLDEDMTSGFLDEIEMEEEHGDGMMEDGEEEEELDGDYDVEDMGDEDMDSADMGDEFGDDMGSAEPASKDDLMNLEDKLDQLIADFEAEFSGAGDEADADMEMGDEEGDEEAEEEGEEEGVMEAVEMKKVSVTHTDGADASAKKGPIAANSGATGMASRPVKFSGSSETAPSSPKGPSNPYAKGETQVKGAGQFKNAPGGGNNVGNGKGESAPKPVMKQASGVNVKDVVPESKRFVKKMIK